MENKTKPLDDVIEAVRKCRGKVLDEYYLKVDNYNKLGEKCEHGSPELVRAWEMASLLDSANEHLATAVQYIKRFHDIV